MFHSDPISILCIAVCSVCSVLRSAQCVLSNGVRLSTYLCFKQLGQTSKLSVQSCSCSAYSAVRRALDVGRWTLPLAALSVPFSLQSRVFRSDNCTTTKYWSMHANGTQSAQSIAAFSCSICAERGATWIVDGMEHGITKSDGMEHGTESNTAERREPFCCHSPSTGAAPTQP